VTAWDRALVGVGSDADLETAAHEAVERLEKQILKLRNKWRHTTRHKEKVSEAVSAVAAPVAARSTGSKKSKTLAAASAKSNGNHSARKKIFRVNHNDGSKPMTVEEAMLEIEDSQDYMVYRDAHTERVKVLMRRPDGHFDLIES
jgi:putative sigma-54 modulation protein